MKNRVVFKLVFCAIMAALSIVLDKIPAIRISDGIKISFYGLPLMVAGIYLGIKHGFITGIVTGTILQLTSEWGISLTSFFWGLAPIAWGGASATIYHFIRSEKDFWTMLLTVTLSSIIATLLNTFAMYMDILLINDTYYTIAKILSDLPFRILSMVILIIPYTEVLLAVTKSLSPVMKFKE